MGSRSWGVINQPVTGERWIGAAGRPTRFSGPMGGEAGCRACPRLDEAELSLTTTEVFGPGDTERWERLHRRVRRTTFGGDCYAYGLLALGYLDVIAEATMICGIGRRWCRSSRGPAAVSPIGKAGR